MKNIFAAMFISVLLIASSANAGLINSGFEKPEGTSGYRIYDASLVPGWETDASDKKIEIWETGFNGVTAYEGEQFAELNANRVAALYQDISGINANETIGWEFAHRGRAGTDTIQLSIIDLGDDDTFDTVDDTTLFKQSFSTKKAAWKFYSGRLSSLTLGNTIRFEWDSITSAGGPSIGNFLDAAAVGTEAGFDEVPEPATLFLFGAGLLALAGQSIKRKKK